MTPEEATAQQAAAEEAHAGYGEEDYGGYGEEARGGYDEEDYGDYGEEAHAGYGEADYGGYRDEDYLRPARRRASAPEGGIGGHSRRRRGRRGQGETRGGHLRGHPLLVTFGAIAVVVVVLAALFAWWATGQISPGGKPGPRVEVVIPAGSSTTRIGRILAKSGVIHSGTLFPYYVRIGGAGTLYPGTYHLPKNESYSAAISALEAGPPIIQDRLLVPEGFTIDQIAAAVAKLPHSHITPAQFIAAAQGGQVRSPYEPAGSNNLEGLLFPATYQIRQGSTAADVVQQMVEAFDANAAQIGLAAGSARLGLKPYQVVTVASMVEKEAKRAQDRGPIASVIYNRLKAGMPLGIDSTLLYGLHTTSPNVNPDTPNPYNTRLNKGLPPTPISNPGLASLHAALTPPATNYLYYAVTGPGGQTSFASTTAGFARIEAQCRQGGYCS